MGYPSMIYLFDEQEVMYTLETIKKQPIVDDDDASLPVSYNFDKWEKDNCTLLSQYNAKKYIYISNLL